MAFRSITSAPDRQRIAQRMRFYRQKRDQARASAERVKGEVENPISSIEHNVSVAMVYHWRAVLIGFRDGIESVIEV